MIWFRKKKHTERIKCNLVRAQFAEHLLASFLKSAALQLWSKEIIRGHARFVLYILYANNKTGHSYHISSSIWWTSLVMRNIWRFFCDKITTHAASKHKAYPGHRLNNAGIIVIGIILVALLFIIRAIWDWFSIIKECLFCVLDGNVDRWCLFLRATELVVIVDNQKQGSRWGNCSICPHLNGSWMNSWYHLFGFLIKSTITCCSAAFWRES